MSMPVGPSSEMAPSLAPAKAEPAEASPDRAPAPAAAKEEPAEALHGPAVDMKEVLRQKEQKKEMQAHAYTRTYI